jgi:hypothetical protein
MSGKRRSAKEDLPKRDPAVIGRHDPMAEGLVAGGCKARKRLLDKERVLKHAAGEAHSERPLTLR